MIERTLQGEDDTRLLAADIARLPLGGRTVALEGELGAGKTTLVRFLVAALGGRAHDVASPTFALEHTYETPNGLEVEHWDLYRLSAAPLELLEPPLQSVVRIIEWASKCPGVGEGAELVVWLEMKGADERLARLSGALVVGMANG